MNRSEINKIHTKLFEAATDVYNIVGAGMPYHIYRSCFLHELRLKSLMFKKDVIFPVTYKDVKVSEITMELVVENNVIVELITDKEINAMHVGAMQSKLRITGMRMGIIITFNVLNSIDGYRKVLINQ